MLFSKLMMRRMVTASPGSRLLSQAGTGQLDNGESIVLARDSELI